MQGATRTRPWPSGSPQDHSGRVAPSLPSQERSGLTSQTLCEGSEVGAALQLPGGSQGRAAPLPPPPRFKDLKALSKRSALSPKGRHTRCVRGPPGCPSPAPPPPAAPTHLWLRPALRAQAPGWGLGQEMSRGADGTARGPLPPVLRPPPPPTRLGVGAGALAEPADRGCVPALTCPAAVARGCRRSCGARRGLGAKVRGPRGGRGRSSSRGGGGGGGAAGTHSPAAAGNRPARPPRRRIPPSTAARAAPAPPRPAPLSGRGPSAGPRGRVRAGRRAAGGGAVWILALVRADPRSRGPPVAPGPCLGPPGRGPSPRSLWAVLGRAESRQRGAQLSLSGAPCQGQAPKRSQQPGGQAPLLPPPRQGGSK